MWGLCEKLGMPSFEMLFEDEMRFEGAATSFYWTLIHSNFKFFKHGFK